MADTAIITNTLAELKIMLTNCENIDNINVYLDNLTTLGILVDYPKIHLASEEPYQKLYNLYESHMNIHEKVAEGDEKIEKIEWEKGHFAITNFGKLFIEVCTRANLPTAQSENN